MTGAPEPDTGAPAVPDATGMAARAERLFRRQEALLALVMRQCAPRLRVVDLTPRPSAVAAPARGRASCPPDRPSGRGPDCPGDGPSPGAPEGRPDRATGGHADLIRDPTAGGHPDWPVVCWPAQSLVPPAGHGALTLDPALAEVVGHDVTGLRGAELDSVAEQVARAQQAGATILPLFLSDAPDPSPLVRRGFVVELAGPEGATAARRAVLSAKWGVTRWVDLRPGGSGTAAPSTAMARTVDPQSVPSDASDPKAGQPAPFSAPTP